MKNLLNGTRSVLKLIILLLLVVDFPSNAKESSGRITIKPPTDWLRELTEWKLAEPYKRSFQLHLNKTPVNLEVDIGEVSRGDTRHVWMIQIRRTIGAFLNRHGAQESLEKPPCTLSYKNGDAEQVTLRCKGRITIMDYRDIQVSLPGLLLEAVR